MRRKLTEIARVEFDLIPEGMPYEYLEQMLKDTTSNLLGKLREDITPWIGQGSIAAPLKAARR